MIRMATYEDIPELVDMLIAFQSEAGCYGQIDPDAKSISNSLKMMIDGENSDIAIYEADGKIAGTTAVFAYPSWFNFSQLTGQEMFWYIKPEFRNKFGIAMRMFNWLEKWAEDHSLKTLTVASTGTLKVEKLEKFYESKGYKKWDVLYTKEIKPCLGQ